MKVSPLIVYGGTSVQEKTGYWRFFRPILSEEKCTGCGRCYLLCPDSAVMLLEVSGKKRKFLPEFNYDYCKGCGICAEVCPVGAISMTPEKK